MWRDAEKRPGAALAVHQATCAVDGVHDQRKGGARIRGVRWEGAATFLQALSHKQEGPLLAPALTIVQQRSLAVLIQLIDCVATALANSLRQRRHIRTAHASEHRSL